MKTFDSDTWKELDKAEMVLARPEAEWREAKSMKRLTSDNTFEMNMLQLALNQVYIGKDGWAQYVEGPDREYSVCDLARAVSETLGVELPMLSDEALSDLLLDWLQYGAEEPEGVVAILYRALCAMAEVRAKLFRYEDTGLEPEEVVQTKLALIGKVLAEIKEFEGVPIERMIELAQAEKDGRLVVLPCKVGDKVKVDVNSWGNVWNYKTYDCGKFLLGEIVSISITRKQFLMKICAKHNVSWKRPMRRYPISALGKTVFLTREEAEAALKKREETDNEADRCRCTERNCRGRVEE